MSNGGFLRRFVVVNTTILAILSSVGVIFFYLADGGGDRLGVAMCKVL